MALGGNSNKDKQQQQVAKNFVSGRTLVSGFRALNEHDVFRNRMIVSLSAPPKRGKTHFSLTAPAPIYYQAIDKGLEGVGRKFIGQKDIRIAEYNFQIPLRSAEKGSQQIVDAANVVLQKFEADMQVALAEAKSVIWDTATEMWELLMIAEFGKLGEVMPHHYAPLNARFRHWIDMFLDSDKNLIMVHKVKDEWKTNDKTGKPGATGRQVRAGFKGAGYDAHVNVECDRDYATGDTDPNAPSGDFFLRVMDCRANAELAGQSITTPMNDFAGLGQLVYPDSSAADWE